MEWKKVSEDEYEQALQKIYEDIRDLVDMIEHDPSLSYEQGFERLKQEYIRYQIVLPLTKIKMILLDLIKQAENKNLGGN
jgi:hypothetical protein